jgi:uncharacterized protein (DUF362 family)/NAD-dependent dihydropyrimidine dehydrogenase PreA subunit
MITEVSIVKCGNYNASLVLEATRKAINLLGGISSFIRFGSKVLVKPNLLMAKEPESGVDTHPEVVRAVIRILKQINCKIYVGDSPSVWGNQIEKVEEVYEVSGIKKVSEEEGAELVRFDKRRWRKNFPLTTWLDNCDYFVSIPKFKTHGLTILTAAIKNLFGLVSGTYKTELHKKYFQAEDFSRIIVDIYEEVKPSLTVIDGIVAMEGDGPATAGKLRNQGLLLAGTDCVALDSVLALIMGLRPDDILSTKEAAQRGLGVLDINSIRVLGEKLADVIGEPFSLPATSTSSKIPQPVINLAKKLIHFYPRINRHNCIRCGTCIQACPQKVITMKNNRIVINYKGCISCFCCLESCPESAIKINKSLLAKMIGL